MNVKSPKILVVFDCDGTLVDSQHNVVACMRAAFAGEGLEVPDDQSIRNTIGLNPDEAVRRLALVPIDENLLVRLVNGYKSGFFQRRLQSDHHEPLYAGARETISELAARNITMAVATGKSLRGLRAVLEQHSLQDYFISLQTPDHNPGKPHPQMLEKAMLDAGTRADQTFMVGDTSFDMMLARNAGCRGIGVRWGYHQEAELLDSGAERLITHFDELVDIVCDA